MQNKAFAQTVESQAFVNDDIFNETSAASSDFTFFSFLLLLFVFIISLFTFLKYKKYLAAIFYKEPRIIEEKEVADSGGAQNEDSNGAVHISDVKVHDVDTESEEYLNKKPQLQIQIENDVAKLVFK